MPSAPMNRGGYPYQFDKEIAKMVYGKYADYPKQFDKIAKISNFPAGKTYTEAEISPLGALRAMGEGESISYDVPVEGHRKSIQTVKFGLGFQKTEEMTADELFNMSTKMSASLSRAAVVCAETAFWNLFANAFTATTGTLCWDDKPVFATNHSTLKSGTTINNKGTAALSQTALEAAFEYYDNLVDEAGMKIMLQPNTLVIPNTLKWVANDILKATGRIWDYSGTGADRTRGLLSIQSSPVVQGPNNGLMNTVNPSNGIVDSWRIFVSRYLSDSSGSGAANDWYFLSDEHDFRFMWKKKPTMSSSSDFDTDNDLYKLIMRFAVGVFDYKGAYGAQVS